MNDGLLLNEIVVRDNEQLEPNIEDGETQLLAIISKKEYISYAIKIEQKDYLMLVDNTITNDFIKLNQNIVVMENNKQKDIKFLIKEKKGILQKKLGNITVTLVRYSGFFNPKTIIEFDENYFKNSKNNNSLLKDYERHLNEFIEDLYIKQPILERNSNLEERVIPCCGIDMPIEIFIFLIVFSIISIILTILGIKYPKFGNFLLALLQVFAQFN